MSSLGISEATFYIWKKEYVTLSVFELRRLQQSGEKNARLKRLVADLMLDKQTLSDAIRKSLGLDKVATVRASLEHEVTLMINVHMGTAGTRV